MADDKDFADMAAEAAKFSQQAPSDRGMSRLSKMGSEMIQLEQDIARLEQELKEKNIRLWDLRTRHMPDLMAEYQVNSITVQDFELTAGPFVKANIVAEWPDEKREAGFKHLEEVGGGDLIRNEIVVVFPRGHYDELIKWREKVRGLNFDFDPPEMVEKKSVPWNTLTAFVKEQLQRGARLDLELLGATTGTIVTIKERKHGS